MLYDPPIATKIATINQCLCWGNPAIIKEEIDQTKLVLDDGENERPDFSFLVLGDTDSDTEYGEKLQAEIAQQLGEHMDTCRFTLHTGDLVYPFGSGEFYLEKFIQFYREVFGIRSPVKKTDTTRLVFNHPIFPVPGNHDYYDLTFLPRLFAQLSLPLRRWIKSKLGLSLGWESSYQGKAYAHAFLDCLSQPHKRRNLAEYLNQHYTAKTKTGRCLRYQPGHFTRLPNRYYTFRYGGIDFFALDSNTFCSSDSSSKPKAGPDREQLDWLQQRLIDSWHDPQVRGRVIYLHHSPYSTEKSRWEQPDAIAVRDHLRQVLDQVAAAIGSLAEKRPLVDLILSGHAHCFEHLRTLDTKHADSNLNWLVCGGSGASLRGQRKDEVEVMEISQGGYVQMVARSLLFIGRKGKGRTARSPHTFLRIDVHNGVPPKFVIRPFIVEKLKNKWSSSAIKPFVLENL